MQGDETKFRVRPLGKVFVIERWLPYEGWHRAEPHMHYVTDGEAETHLKMKGWR